jgi:hypothetical protein
MLGFVVVGLGIVGTQSTWRETIAGLGLHYVGIAGLLALSAGLASGVAEAIVATGVLLLLANDGSFAGAPEAEPETPSRPIRHRSGGVARARPEMTSPVVLVLRQIGSNLLARPFDTSVVALAAVGAIALAVTRPLFGPLGVDGAVNVLLIGGILGCLLGGETRVAGGLLFIISAAGLALHAADPTPRASESILLALTQIALALVLVYLRSLRGEPAGRVAGAVAPVPQSDHLEPEDLPNDAIPDPVEGA